MKMNHSLTTDASIVRRFTDKATKVELCIRCVSYTHVRNPNFAFDISDTFSPSSFMRLSRPRSPLQLRSYERLAETLPYTLH